MYATKNDLPEKTRAEVIELLNARLADALHTTEHSAGDKAAFPATKKSKWDPET